MSAHRAEGNSSPRSTPPPGGALPPAAAVMQMMMGAWSAQTIAAVTRLDVPEILAKHGPLTAAELTADHGVDAKPAFLERALRACASVGIFTESPDGRFGPTPLSQVLTLRSSASVRRFVELIGGRWWTLFGALPEALRTGQDQSKSAEGGEPWAGADRQRTEQFGEAMKSGAAALREMLLHYDFSWAKAVIDIGGGFGHLAIALLERHLHLRATVLELPDVVGIAERHVADVEPAVRARLSLVAGDMFEDVPAGDLYVLRRIIHDWDDERAVRVLRNCRARLPDGGRVLCIDNVLPPMGDTGGASARLLDMLMMVSLPGRERTEAEWRVILEAASLRLARIVPVNPRSAESLIEGVP